MARTPAEADRSSSADRAILADGYDFLLTSYRRDDAARAAFDQRAGVECAALSDD